MSFRVWETPRIYRKEYKEFRRVGMYQLQEDPQYPLRDWFEGLEKETLTLL
jgi:hypothetical protein